MENKRVAKRTLEEMKEDLENISYLTKALQDNSQKEGYEMSFRINGYKGLAKGIIVKEDNKNKVFLTNICAENEMDEANNYGGGENKKKSNTKK